MTIQELGGFTLEMFRPPKKLTVSQWADTYRNLVTESSAEPGKWHTDRAPYQKEIMDAFTQPGVWKIVLKSSSQVGKSEIELNMMGRAIDLDPGPMLYVQPTDAMAEDYSKRRITPMINACPTLRYKVFSPKGRDSNNTITMKSFPGGSVALTGANSPSELASRPVRYVFMDEIDRFPKSAGTEGDPIELAERRTETFRHNRKVVMTSTPTDRQTSPIERHFLSGTQEEWHTQCPHCGKWSFIRFEDIRFEKEKRDERSWKVWDVRWKCAHCARDSGEYETKRCPGKWVARNPEAQQEGIRSFWLNAFMSPWSDWRDIVLKFLAAKDKPELLKVFRNTMLGELWEMSDLSGDPERLYNRREHYNAEVPTGVQLLTMGVDVQDNRLEYEIVGWNRDGESWGIYYGVIPGTPDAPGVWEQIDALLDREYKTASGYGLRVMGAFIDSGGHYTQTIYKECSRRRGRNIWPIKGEGGEGKSYVRPMKGSSPYGDMRFMMGVDSGKEMILYAANIEEPGTRYMHYPVDYRHGYSMEYFRGLFSEKKVTVRRGGRDAFQWIKTYERNEPLDCRNYAMGVFKYFRWNFDKFEKQINGEDMTPAPVTKAQAEKKKHRYVISRGIEI